MTANRLILGVVLVLSVAGPTVGTGRAAEPWADQGLKVTDGLALWLDASKQPAAWKAHGKPAIGHEASVDVCYDASGHRRHAVQPHAMARPKLAVSGDAAALRFDGTDDYLSILGMGRDLKDTTLFIVAMPRSNTGNFRAIFSASQAGKNDFTSGLNLDQGSLPTNQFEAVNVEGAGMPGQRDLMEIGHLHKPFDRPAVLGVVSRLEDNKGETRLFVNGWPGERRDRGKSVIHTDVVLLGARLYGEPPSVQGFFNGHIAEVLLYDRVLDDKQREQVTKYLIQKYEKFVPSPDEGPGKPLVPLENPPLVQMFVPGFTARELPLKLKNINNVRYRADGKLVALGYNGDIHILSDTDGDGLEDKSELFWESKGKTTSPIGMSLTPPNYPHGNGMFVAAKGKISLFIDKDGDDKGDEERIVAEGWQGTFHGVDALGVTIAPDGSVYFGLGTSNFADPYLMDKATGKSGYDIRNQRGTIQRIAPDLKSRKIIATGIRFPVGLEFNRHGDLFCTDQEGATWVPNGNPFDELLHIQEGRHYGFPARHPKHLMTDASGNLVIDEPSVYDYAPQHQSTCGLFFNESVNGGPVFGPEAWTSDALVCGESRGKLFRTKLIKTPAGYVAQNHWIASLTMLLIDATVTPKGDLVVSTHSGPPDWGTGPEGEGKLYKISYTGKDDPQPVGVWASGEREVRIAFDQPLEPSRLQNVAAGTRIEYGRDVSPGDRFTALWPPYEIVRGHREQRRQELKVLSAGVTGDRRTLVLMTEPHPRAVRYAITLPGLGRPEKAADDEIQQVPEIDLGYDLSGVQGSFHTADGNPVWEGWLPHPDPAVSRAFTAGSADHALLWESASKAGKLGLRMNLDLTDMLRPAIQPGSQIDFQWPSERVTIVFRASGTLSVSSKAGQTKKGKGPDGTEEVSLTVSPKAGELVPVEIALSKMQGDPRLELFWYTAEDSRHRAMPLRRIYQPWARLAPSTSDAQIVERKIPEIEGGDWARGREVYFSEEAMCGKCHRIRGEGNNIGPDLTNLIHRDYASVWRDVTMPSVAINPDHVAFSITLKDGNILFGVPRTLDEDRLLVGEAGGKETEILVADIASREPSSTSVMPAGIDQILGKQKMKDLMTFLLTEPLAPAKIEREGAPPPRKYAEVEAVLKAAKDEDRKPDERPLRILLAAGPKDHGPGEHDYPLWQQRWSKLLPMSEGVEVSTCMGFPTPEQFSAADVVVFFSNNPGFTAEKATQLDDFLARGGGLVYLHWAVDGKQHGDALAKRIGLAARGMVKFRHGEMTLDFKDKDHPITRGFDKLTLVDETYWAMIGDEKQIHLLATAVEDGQPRPQLWTREQGKGRVMVCIGGHYNWTFDDPLFRIIVLRGIAWTAGRPAERLARLATIGARVTD